MAYLISNLKSYFQHIKLPRNLRLTDPAWKTDHALYKFPHNKFRLI